ncbi:Uncharacterised protein [Klebsiella oxytoca]|nr:Uncharacterised protein [Klebsiella oxytoca]
MPPLLRRRHRRCRFSDPARTATRAARENASPRVTAPGKQQNIGVTRRRHHFDPKALGVEQRRQGGENLDLAAVAAAAVHPINVGGTLNFLQQRCLHGWRWTHPPSSAPECRCHRAGLISCSSAGLSHMASQFNTVGRHQALLAFALRAGLEAFAMQLGAAIAVVFEQRDGIVDLFLYGEWAFTHPAVANGKTRLLEKILFLPYRQLVLLRELNRRRRADLFAAPAENATPEVELPRQLVGGEIGFLPSGRSTDRR